MNENADENQMNPKQKAVVQIRQLTTGLRNEWTNIKDSARRLKSCLLTQNP